MATAAFKADINPAGNANAITAPDNAGAVYAIGDDDPINDTYAAVDAALGVLVADGVLPTEEHVTTLNAAWDDFTDEFILLGAAMFKLAPYAGVQVTVDLTTVGTITKLRKALNAILDGAKASGNFGA